MADTKFYFDEDKLLINLIEKHRPLYDPQNESYKDGCIRDSIWSAIATKLNKTDVDCKKRWKHIRDSYNRHKRKIRSSTGSAPRSKYSKWDFFEKLIFLEQVPTESNIDSDSICSMTFSVPLTQPSTLTLEQQINDNEDSPSSLQSSPVPSPRTRHTHCDELQQQHTTEESRNILMQGPSLMISEANDEDDTFGNHVKSVLRKLPPRLKLHAKGEIFATLVKYETSNLDILEEKSTSTPISSATISTI